MNLKDLKFKPIDPRFNFIYLFSTNDGYEIYFAVPIISAKKYWITFANGKGNYISFHHKQEDMVKYDLKMCNEYGFYDDYTKAAEIVNKYMSLL